jgi:hypothetical protein
MIAALGCAAAICLFMAFAPFSMVDAAGNVLAVVCSIERTIQIASIQELRSTAVYISAFNVLFAFALIGLFGLARAFLRPIADETWNCGYSLREARCQYTARSFAQLATEYLLPRFLRPKSSLRVSRALFADRGSLTVSDADPIEREVLVPWFRRWARRFLRLRVLQQGLVNLYLAYIALAVVVALTWMSARTWWWRLHG